MPIDNVILRWIIMGFIAFGYGVLVQRVLGYTRGNLFLTISIGAVGILLGKFVLPHFLNIHPIINIVGVPLVSSLIGSFILPGIMWFFRSDNVRWGKFGNKDEDT